MEETAGNSSSTFQTKISWQEANQVNSSIFVKWLNKASSEYCTTGPNIDFLREVSSPHAYFRDEHSSTTTTKHYFVEASFTAHSSLSEARAEVVRAALLGVYALDAAGKNRKAAQELMRFIEDHLHATSLDVANKTLLEADVNQMSSRSLIGLIRTTARASAALPAWKLAYKASRKAISTQGKNPDALFVGLQHLAES